ncbi:serine hydrolase domain-containing protein [Flavobacterium rakeshii]|uniref:serine hydrolase domain-containing protein n=1 Tax=Flavobacterium rakeshii TaxID=1038845 RepID=UPI002E7C423F|nr:serine hydrolase domain-containing protein [Flavobacterium rakeshii]MEE1897850.1 serine hydrolase domain-containing protein [Flavobacterium rakeshii]
MRKTALFLFFLMASAQGIAQTEPKFEKIDQLLNHFYTNDRFMGSVSIREGNDVVFENAYGYTDAENGIKANTHTKYKIGSITKMFTAAIVLQLIEDKKLTLNTKLSQFYPEVKNADSITIDHLLSHKSGIYNYTNADDFVEYTVNAQTKMDMLKRIAGFDPVFKPGEKAEYSNSNYVLLGYIIEDVTKKTYKANVNDRITRPLKLTDTYYYSKTNPKRNEAYSYTFEGGKWVQSDQWDSSVAYAAGALVSTPNDLTKFIKALFDGKIIKKESLEIMKTMDMGYGRGMFIFPFNSRNFYGHNGGIESFTSVLGYYPKEQMSISVIQNGSNYDLNEILIGILSCYYKIPYPLPNLTIAEVASEVLKGYEGTYDSSEIPLEITVKYTENGLTAQATGQSAFPLTPTSDNQFIFNQANIEITFKDNNSFILKQGQMQFNYTRKEQ